MAANNTTIGRIARKNVKITFQKSSISVDKYRNHLQE